MKWYLDIEGIGGQEFLIDVVSLCPDAILIAFVVTRAVFNLPE